MNGDRSISELGGPHVLERPWARIDHPTPLPERADAAELLRLEDVAFAELLRDNLTPRNNSPGVRERWDRLWMVLAANDELADRTLDTLEAFEQVITALQAHPGASEKDLTRARKFVVQVDMAAKRLESRAPKAEPLAWLGPRANRYNTPGRADIDQLVTAIAEHRAATRVELGSPADIQLWDVLERLRLDPGW